MKKRKFDEDSIKSSIVLPFQRNFPHVDGDWPSHIYIPVNSKNSISSVTRRCIHHFLFQFNIPIEEMELEENLHISLSKTFSLRFHQIDLFVEQLSDALEYKHQFILPVESRYYILPNENKSRYFVCLPLSDVNNHLSGLVHDIDEVFIKYRKSIFYNPAKFHISIASMKTKPIHLNIQNVPIVDPIATIDDLVIKSLIDKPNTPSELGKKDLNLSVENDFLLMSTIEDNIYSVDQNFEYNNQDDNQNNEEDSEMEDENDDSLTSCRLNISKQKEGITTILINIKSIECKIGNRIFHLNMRTNNSNSNSSSNSIDNNPSLNRFVELT